MKIVNAIGASVVDHIHFLLERQFTASREERAILEKHSPGILSRVEECFEGIEGKYFEVDSRGEKTLDLLHGDHVATLLWFAGNSLWRAGEPEGISVKLSYLNKIMHGLDAYHFIDLPDHFYFSHPVGTVLGRAKYGDHLKVMQGVTVGGKGNQYPEIGSNVILASNSSVLGESHISDNVVVGAGALIVGDRIPPNCAVVGRHPSLRIISRLE